MSPDVLGRVARRLQEAREILDDVDAIITAEHPDLETDLGSRLYDVRWSAGRAIETIDKAVARTKT
jgi:hypothetical protein